MKKKDFLLKTALWSCGFGAFSDGVVIPLTNLIIEEYPNISDFMLNMILSGSGLFALPAALLTAWVIKKVDLRKVLIVGLTMFFIGGVGGAFSPGLGFLVGTRIFDGISDGILGVAAIAAIARLFPEEDERSSVLGGYNAVSALFGLVVSALAGIIAQYSWRSAFYCNAVSAIGLLLTIATVPSMPPIKEEESGTKICSGGEKTGHIWIGLVAFMVSAALITQTYYLADIYVAEHAIGTSVESGTLLSILTICNLASGVTFPFLYKKLKNKFTTFIFAVTALSIFIQYYGYSYISAAIGLGLAGFIEGTGYVYYSMFVTEEAPQEKVGLFAAAFNFAVYIVGFTCTYIPSIIGGALGIESISGTYIVSALICLVMLVICLIVESRAGKNEKEEEEQ